MYFWHDKGCLIPFVKCISLVVFDYKALFFSSRILVRSRHLHQMSYSSCHPVRKWNMSLPLSYLRCVLKTQISACAVFLHKEGDKLSCTNQLLRRHETQFSKALILSSVFSDMCWCHYTTNIIYTIKFNCYRYDNIQLIYPNRWWTLMMYSLCSRH